MCVCVLFSCIDYYRVSVRLTYALFPVFFSNVFLHGIRCIEAFHFLSCAPFQETFTVLLYCIPGVLMIHVGTSGFCEDFALLVPFRKERNSVLFLPFGPMAVVGYCFVCDLIASHKVRGQSHVT